MEVIKPGLLDTFQDNGRHGYAHLGVGMTGCMDKLAGSLCNWLAGNPDDVAVLEMHFPAPVLHFPEGAIIALSGADFNGQVLGTHIPLNRRVVLPPGSSLQFKQKIRGERCYLSVKGGWQISPLMGSFSTHLKAGFGGWQGRGLKKGDTIPLNKRYPVSGPLPELTSWFVNPDPLYSKGPVRVIQGPEWHWLEEESRLRLTDQFFIITNQNDRMGYHLKGIPLLRSNKGEMLSSGVLPGTIQCLPGGQPLLLMADCQTTGGYPRILQVAAVDLPKLAQMGTGESISFSLISMEEAKDLWFSFQNQLGKIKGSIALNIFADASA